MSLKGNKGFIWGLVGAGVLLFTVWAVNKESAEFLRTHECHWQTEEKMERVSALAGWFDEWQSDPVVGPSPKYTKIGDRYYQSKTVRVEKCVTKKVVDPVCDSLSEKDASGTLGLDRVAKYVKLENGKDHWLWASYADYKKYGRCFPSRFGPDFVFYGPTDKSEVAVCSAAVPFPPFKRTLEEAKAAGCEIVTYEDSLAIKADFEGKKGAKR